ncbi:phycobilisome rod-core linker polypeptide [Egbenema bharatensis]|uniref:phycobilisome rod-core linker polypeptide n=1 Tax=Egbenema bharatensis TaxID=3463334 RepID=UPI003A89FED9
MSLPLLTYPLSSQNQRVNGFEIPGDEQSWIYTTDNAPIATELDEIIWAAYRQIFNEQQILQHHWQVRLESQLRSRQITVREFIRGLVLSDSFRRLNYDSNNNYRFVEMCIQRILGRNVYGDREKLAWSTVLATKGLRGFVNDLLNSEEYLTHFGDNTVPYQRRRILPQRVQGELPFARIARYDDYHFNQLVQLGQLRPVRPEVVDRSAPVYRRVLVAVPTASLALLFATLILVATS